MDASYTELYYEGEGLYTPSYVTDGDRTVAVYERLQDDGAANPEAMEVTSANWHRFYVVHLGSRDEVLSSRWWRDPIWLPNSGMIKPCDREMPSVLWWRGEGYYERSETGDYSKTDCNRGHWVTVNSLFFYNVIGFNDGRMSFAFVPAHYAKEFMRRQRVSKNTGKFLDGALAAH